MARREVDPVDLIEKALSANWDTSELDSMKLDIEEAPNSIQYMVGSQFHGMSPWPRQIEFALKTFEDYCPYCSDMTVVNDCWGRSLDSIRNRVQFLEFGKCPKCRRTRIDFWKEELHQGRQELIGVAGQRCLDPDLLVRMADGILVSLALLKKGDLLQDRNGTVTEVTKVWPVQEPGYFVVFMNLPDGKTIPIKCGHEHAWVTDRGVIATTELCYEDRIEFGESWATVRIIKKYPGKPVNLIDIETTSGTFLHVSGLTLHNSGKTLITAVFSSYILHKYLSMDGLPCSRYGLRNTVLMGTFIAADNKQVSETTWGQFAAEIESSPWYKTYFALLKEEEKRTGTEMYKFKPEYALAFMNKKLLFSHATGDYTGLRGRTRILGSIDELGWFESNERAKRRAGLEIYTSLNNSLKTIRSAADHKRMEGQYDLPTAYMFNVSSPAAEDDPIMTLKSKAGTAKKTFCFHLPTWEINPGISLEDFEDDMKKDPVKIMRDFGAQPGAGRNIYLPNAEIILASVDEKRESGMKFHKEFLEIDIKNTPYTYVYPKLDHIMLDRTTPYILAGDAGESGNSFSLMLCSLDENVTIVNAGVVVQPVGLASGKIATVHFPSVLQFILDLRRHITLRKVVFDRWQSTFVIQALRDQDIDAEKFSLRYEHFKLFKQRFYEERFRLPKPEVSFDKIMLQHLDDKQPSALLIKQLRTVRDNGRQVMKPAAEDDDLFRCLVLADKFLQEDPEAFRKIDVLRGRGGHFATYSSKEIPKQKFNIQLNTGRTFIQKKKTR
jgi:hypothetical protein